MANFDFTAHFGEEEKLVSISHDQYGTWCYTVSISGYYSGMLCHNAESNAWRWHFYNSDWITMADIDILIDLVNENFL